MMPNQNPAQPIAAQPPGPGARSLIAPAGLSRREVFADAQR